jgi:hypothetical protein
MNETAKTETAKTETGKGRPAKTYRETTANDQATIANVVAFLATAKPDIKAWGHPSKHDAYDVAYSMTIDGVNYSVKVYCTPDVSEATQRERIAELTAQNERMARSLRYVGCCQTVTFAQFAQGKIGYTVDANGNKAPDFLAIETVRVELASLGIDAQGRPDDYLLPIVVGDWVYTYSRDNSLGFTVTPVVK